MAIYSSSVIAVLLTHIVRFIVDRESPDTDEELGQLLISLPLDLALDVLSKSAPPTQPYTLSRLGPSLVPRPIFPFQILKM